MRTSIPILAVAFCLFAPCACAADKNAFEGTVSAMVTRASTDATQLLFTRKGNQLRIENTDKSKAEPIDIVDLDAGRLTILFPHNATFIHVDLTKAPMQPGAPLLPPGFATPAKNATQGAHPTQSDSRPAPQISPPPGLPPRPPMPALPQVPNPAAAEPMIPAMPPMPAMIPGGAPELKKTDKTRKIQGFECTCYTISDRMENFEIWATPDSALFPFHLLERNYDNRHFGPVMLEEQWGELLQKKSLFPMEATLRTKHSSQERFSPKVGKIEKKEIDNGAERFHFEVKSITPEKITDTEGRLFQPPAGYFEIQSLPF